MKKKKIRLNIQAKIILIGAGLSALLMVAAFLFSFFIYKERIKDNLYTSLSHCVDEYKDNLASETIENEIDELMDYIKNAYEADPNDEYMDDFINSKYADRPEYIASLTKLEKEYLYYSQKKYGQLYPNDNGMGSSLYNLRWKSNYYQLSAMLSTAYATQGVQNTYLAFKDEERNRLVYVVDSEYQLDEKVQANTLLPGSFYELQAGDGVREQKDGYAEFLANGRTSLCFDLYMHDEVEPGVLDDIYLVTVFIEYNEDTINDATKSFLFTELIALSIATVVLVVLYAILVHFVIIKNVTKLSNTTESFTKKALDGDKLEVIDPEVKAEDELGDLSKSFVTLEKEIINYTDKLEKDAQERAHLSAELSIASQIQEEELPATKFETDASQIVASMTPAKEVGGDFYDYYFVDKTHLVLVIADVTGKGVPAALFMMKAKGLIKTKMQAIHDLKQAIGEVNDELIENNKTNMFVTAFVGVVDLETGDMECVSAGHERPYILSQEGVTRMDINPNFVLGGLKGFNFAVEKTNLKGKRLFLFTDGLNESINDASEEFGYERIEESLSRAKDLSQEEMLSQIKQDLRMFVGKREAFDDVTLLSFEIKDQEDFSLHLTDPNFDAIEQVADAFNARFAHIELQKMQEFDIIIDELLNNLISYEKVDGFVIDIEAEEKHGKILFKVSSNGKEFNPLASDDKYISSGDDLSGVSIGGFGITIVKNLCDSISYERKDGKNVLTLEKSITAKQ